MDKPIRKAVRCYLIKDNYVSDLLKDIKPYYVKIFTPRENAKPDILNERIENND